LVVSGHPTAPPPAAGRQTANPVPRPAAAISAIRVISPQAGRARLDFCGHAEAAAEVTSVRAGGLEEITATGAKRDRLPARLLRLLLVRQ
jgi:hypothetical protein